MFVLDQEQILIRDTARAWLQEHAPVSAFRRMRDSGQPSGFDPDLWASQSAMGWAGIVVPEAHEGLGLGWRTLGLVMEEMGRVLCASPLAGSAIAASALVLAGNDAQKAAWLPGIASGERIAALAVDEGPRHAPEAIAMTAAPCDEGWRLSGRKTFVLEGMAADVLIVAARTSGEPGEAHGISLFIVAGDAPGLTRRPLVTIDSRGSADIMFQGVAVGPDALIGTANQGSWVLDAVLDRGRALICAEMLGVASQAFALTLDYLKIREQFGQLIGSFQALQHRAAAMFGELELAKSCVGAALAACDDEATDRALLVSVAKAKMGEALFLISNEVIQMHGGIGMTDAHDAGLYLKRARALEATFGNRAFHRDRFARLRGF